MLDVELGRLFAAISKNVQNQFKNRLSDIDFDFDFDSNYRYFQYLIVISLYDGINQNELSGRMNVSKGSTSKAVKYLLNNGLIIAKKDETDSRIKHIYITQKGKEIADRFRTFFFEINDKLVEGFSESEVNILRSLLERIYKNTVIDENNFILESLNFLNK